MDRKTLDRIAKVLGFLSLIGLGLLILYLGYIQTKISEADHELLKNTSRDYVKYVLQEQHVNDTTGVSRSWSTYYYGVAEHVKNKELLEKKVRDFLYQGKKLDRWKRLSEAHKSRKRREVLVDYTLTDTVSPKVTAVKTNCMVETTVLKCSRVTKLGCPPLFQVMWKTGAADWRSSVEICTDSCRNIGKIGPMGFFSQVFGYAPFLIAIPSIVKDHKDCSIEVVNVTNMLPDCEEDGYSLFCAAFYQRIGGYHYLSQRLPDKEVLTIPAVTADASATPPIKAVPEKKKKYKLVGDFTKEFKKSDEGFDKRVKEVLKRAKERKRSRRAAPTGNPPAESSDKLGGGELKSYSYIMNLFFVNGNQNPTVGHCDSMSGGSETCEFGGNSDWFESKSKLMCRIVRGQYTVKEIITNKKYHGILGCPPDSFASVNVDNDGGEGWRFWIQAWTRFHSRLVVATTMGYTNDELIILYKYMQELGVYVTAELKAITQLQDAVTVLKDATTNFSDTTWRNLNELKNNSLLTRTQVDNLNQEMNGFTKIAEETIKLGALAQEAADKRDLRIEVLEVKQATIIFDVMLLCETLHIGCQDIVANVTPVHGTLNDMYHDLIGKMKNQSELNEKHRNYSRSLVYNSKLEDFHFSDEFDEKMNNSRQAVDGLDEKLEDFNARVKNKTDELKDNQDRMDKANEKESAGAKEREDKVNSNSKSRGGLSVGGSIAATFGGLIGGGFVIIVIVFLVCMCIKRRREG